MLGKREVSLSLLLGPDHLARLLELPNQRAHPLDREFITERNLLGELGYRVEPTRLHVLDNRSLEALISNLGLSGLPLTLISRLLLELGLHGDKLIHDVRGDIAVLDNISNSVLLSHLSSHISPLLSPTLSSQCSPLEASGLFLTSFTLHIYYNKFFCYNQVVVLLSEALLLEG